MIDIPLGKALVPVETDKEICADCTVNCRDCECIMACLSSERKDNKTIIFKLVDYTEEDEDV